MPSIRFRLFGALTLAAAVGLLALAPQRARAEIDPKSITLVPFGELKFTGDRGKPSIDREQK